jgi:hypothetical protein
MRISRLSTATAAILVVIVFMTMALFAACSSRLALSPSAVPVPETAFDCSGVTEIPRSECEALAIFYESTNGRQWRQNSGWVTV